MRPVGYVPYNNRGGLYLRDVPWPRGRIPDGERASVRAYGTRGANCVFDLHFYFILPSVVNILETDVVTRQIRQQLQSELACGKLRPSLVRRERFVTTMHLSPQPAFTVSFACGARPGR